MKMTAALVCAATFLASGVAFADDDPGKALFEAKCKLCHGLDRPLDQRKDRIGWTTVVMRMKESNGCPISDSEAEQIIAYLARIRGLEGR